MASARRGFLRWVVGAVLPSAFVVIRVFELKNNGLALAFCKFFFVEDGIGNHVFLGRPIAQVAFAAALAAKGEVCVNRRVRLNLTDGTFVFHGVLLFFSVNSVLSAHSA